jgi:hypothetical protein
MSSFKLRKEKDCLNCGHLVEEHFCPQCGQENIVVKENAFQMVSHAIADYFHFEHKFFATLKPLLLKPGKLTEAYVAGKRVSFIHPIRLYIFVSIVFFLVVFSGKSEEPDVNPTASKTNSSKLTQAQKDSLIAVNVKNFNKAMKYVPLEKEKKDSIISEIKRGIQNDNEIKTQTWNRGKDLNFGKLSSKDTTVAQYEKNQSTLTKTKRDGFIKHYLVKRTIELNNYPNPKEKFVEDLVHNVPKMMFLILPIFAMILKLVYINKNRYYYEHLIYSFHIHSAMFLAILFTMLLQWIFGYIYNISDWLSILCAIYFVWYIYRSLRTFYGSTRWVTLLKMFFLFICYNFVLLLCFLIIIAISFAFV